MIGEKLYARNQDSGRNIFFFHQNFSAGFTLETPFVKDTLHLSALLLVILLGMALRTVLHVPAWAAPGVRVAQRPVLRWAVAGLGFRLSIGEILKIGGPALGVVVTSTFVASRHSPLRKRTPAP